MTSHVTSSLLRPAGFTVAGTSSGLHSTSFSPLEDRATSRWNASTFTGAFVGLSNCAMRFRERPSLIAAASRSFEQLSI